MSHADARSLAKLFMAMEADGAFERVRASTVLEGIRLSHGILKDLPADTTTATSPPEAEYKDRVNFLVGEAFVIEKVFFMCLNVPKDYRKKLQAKGFLEGHASAVVGVAEPLSFETPLLGRICGCSNDKSRYQVVPYTLLETGVVKRMEEVEPGEMFIYGEDVYLRTRYDSLSFASTLDGGVFLGWDDVLVDRSKDVTILKPEFVAKV